MPSSVLVRAEIARRTRGSDVRIFEPSLLTYQRVTTDPLMTASAA